MNEDQPTITITAAELGVSARTVRNLLDSGELKGRRKTNNPQSHRVVYRSPLDEYIKKRDSQ